ncbi:unnamed protein product [Adineta steineri]|uniref:Uncharacterized protein n=1 Tax=Adineta steineri TaxID=433720 RepID=A0A818YF08_9BILA|nr:unnamed protein product [Adineta steineri]
MSYTATYPQTVSPPVYSPPINQFVPTPEISTIRDWLPWSIINLFIGWGLGGILPLIFSIVCRSNKRSNDISTARAMSTLALVFNIIITLCGIASWIGFIVWLVIFLKVVNNNGYPYIKN